MTLENLARIGKLKAHAADEREIARLLESAERALKDASAPGSARIPVSSLHTAR